MNKNFSKISILIAMSLWGSHLMAGSVTIPNTFVSGAAASAAEVNANFGVLKTEVGDNDSRIRTNAGDINANTSNITANTNAINSAAGIGGVGVFVNGARVGSLLSLGQSHRVLLTSGYLTSLNGDGTGPSVSSDALFTTGDCTGQSYAFPFTGSLVTFSGYGSIFKTTEGDVVPYRYVVSNSTTEVINYNSVYTAGACNAFTGTDETVIKTFPNDSNVTGVTDAELIGKITLGQ